MQEKDMFAPVAAYLTSLGYEVMAEVKDCDIAAKKEEELLLCEMKTGFTLKLVYQALDRQKISPYVAVVIPRPKRQKGSPWRDILALCKRLDLGLMTVAMDSPMQTVEVHLWPAGSRGKQLEKRKQELARELSGRSENWNTGGSNRRKLMTAYREKMIALACFMEDKDEVSTAQMREAFGEDGVRMMSNNYYGWTKRVSKGVYSLSEKCKAELDGPDFAETVAFYRSKNKA